MYKYHFVRDAIEHFDGDEEKFFLLFYDSEKTFSNFMFEVVNSVLPQLNCTITPERSFSKICEFTEKERNFIKYIS